MMRVVLAVLLLGFPIFVLIACSSSSNPANPGADPVVEDDFTIPPYNVLRHGLRLEDVWANEVGSITVGELGMAFLTTPDGRFMLPTPTSYDLMSTWVTPDGFIFIGSATGDHGSYMYRFQDGRRVATSGKIRSFLATSGRLPSGNLPVYTALGRGILRFDGHNWEDMDGLAPSPIEDISPLFSGDIWVAWRGGVSLYDIRTQRFSTQLQDGSWYEGISALAVDSVMTVGGPVGAKRIWRLNQDFVFEPVHNSPERLFDICWLEADFALAVGEDGATVEWNGANWIPRHMDPPVDLKAVALWKEGGARHAVAVGDSGGVFDFFEGQWTGGASPKITCTELTGGSPSLMYALNEGRIMKYDGDWQPLPAAGSLALHDFCCQDGDTVWAVGKQDIDTFYARYDGTSWYTMWISSMGEANDIWAADNHNVFIACDNGTVYGSASFWAPMSVVQPVQHLRGIWGASPTSVYVVGDNGTISHWDGFTWTPMDSGTDHDLRVIWGSSDDNVVVGDWLGTVWRYDGDSWTSLGRPLRLGVDLLWCDGPDNIWAVDGDQTVAHYDGTGWEERDPQLNQIEITGMWGQGEDLFILAEHDMLLRYQPPPVDLAKRLVR